MIIQDLKIQPYETIWDEMKTFVDSCTNDSTEEIWLLEHLPVFTLGTAAKEIHVLQNPRNIPLVRSDRGGQVTYHGPGQLIIYPLLNLEQRKLPIKRYIACLELMLIDVLKSFNISANTCAGKPGVYVGEAKIASLGLRVRRGWTMHGASLNVNMDLNPFTDINPCGFTQQKMLQMRDFVPDITLEKVKAHCLNLNWQTYFT